MAFRLSNYWTINFGRIIFSPQYVLFYPKFCFFVPISKIILPIICDNYSGVLTLHPKQNDVKSKTTNSNM